MSTAKKAAPKKESAFKAREYTLLKYEPLSFTLKTGRDNNLVVFDENKGINRAIKHCPNEKSIFVDEQSSNSVVKEIIFLNGLFQASEKDVLTQQFLEAHPSKGILFDVIDPSAQAEDFVDEEEIILDIKSAIRSKVKEKTGVEELRAIVSVLISDVAAAAEMSVHELKQAAYESVDSNFYRFINDDGDITIFDDPDITRRAVAQQAFSSGVIRLSPNSNAVLWSDNKATICSIPLGQNYLDFFSSFLATEEGLLVMREIDKRS